jgi:hypothetical protein
LPIPATGAATQEPVAQDTVTPFVSYKIAETAIHSVAETQEPALAEAQATATAETQEPAADIDIELQEPDTQTSFISNEVAETQEPATDTEIDTQKVETPGAPAETQEPAADIDTEMQESEVEGAETLLSLHQEAETQASVAIPVAAPQEPAKETMTATQEPVISKSKPTMADVLEENEFLKSQLEAYQQELARAREAYEKELNRYALERTATLAEQTTESICKEYMCCQCGDIYYRAGYKIFKCHYQEQSLLLPLLKPKLNLLQHKNQQVPPSSNQTC